MATKSLYVGNIPYSANEETLTTAFAPYSAGNVRIVEGRGFAFLDVNSDQVEAAIEGMNGKSMEGRTLVVNEARPRENSGGGGGGNRLGGYSSAPKSNSNSNSSRGAGFGGRGNRW
jgi:cold-inducible RNA-binding protein